MLILCLHPTLSDCTNIENTNAHWEHCNCSVFVHVDGKGKVNEWSRGAELKPMSPRAHYSRDRGTSARHDSGIADSRALNVHLLHQASLGFDAADWCCSPPQWWS